MLDGAGVGRGRAAARCSAWRGASSRSPWRSRSSAGDDAGALRPDGSSMLFALGVVVLNAHVVTLDEARPTATCLAAVDGRLTYVGDDPAAARRAAGADAQLVDAGTARRPRFQRRARALRPLGDAGRAEQRRPLREREEELHRGGEARSQGAPRPTRRSGLAVRQSRIAPPGIHSSAGTSTSCRGHCFVVTHRAVSSTAAACSPRTSTIKKRRAASCADASCPPAHLGGEEACRTRPCSTARATSSTSSRVWASPSVQLIDELPELFEELRRQRCAHGSRAHGPLGYHFVTASISRPSARPPPLVRVDGVKYFHDDWARITRYELDTSSRGGHRWAARRDAHPVATRAQELPRRSSSW